MLLGPPKESYERLESVEDRSAERRMARDAATVAWCFASSASNGSEHKEDRGVRDPLRMVRVDMLLRRYPFPL